MTTIKTERGKIRFKIWLVMIGVFALGLASGALLDGAYRLKAGGRPTREARDGERGGGRRDKEDIFETMKRDLDLSDAQSTEIRRILEATRNDYRALRAEVRPRYDQLRQNSRARIRALLNAEQQQRFDQKVAERDARRDHEEKKGDEEKKER